MDFFQHFLRRPLTRREAEMAYLNQAVSLYDLECRERDVAAGRFAGY